jgi:tetratricopeptide (TPR) repeat protein
MTTAARIPRSSRAVAMLACGFALILAPAIARNLVVGAPALKTTTRGAVEFVNGNNPYHPGIGWFDGDDERVAAYARETLHRSRGKLLPTIQVVLETWKGRLAGFLGLQAKKLGFLLAPFEMPNNASYAYFRMNSPVLGIGLPTFFLISPMAALGLILTAPDRRRLMPHYLFLAVGFAATVGFYVIARFRIPYLPLLLVFAGRGASALLSMAQGRRWGALAGSGTILVLLLSLNAWASYPDTDLVRPQDFLIASRAYEEQSRIAEAVEELERGRGIFPSFVPLHVRAGQLLARSGEIDGALSAFKEALRLEPGSRQLQEAVRALERTEGRQP